MRAVRVNGQITELKQPRPCLILIWLIIWRPQYFFRFGRNIGHIRQTFPAQSKYQINYAKYLHTVAMNHTHSIFKIHHMYI